MARSELHSVPYPPKLILNSFWDCNGGGPICYESTGREIVKPAKITGDRNFIHKLVHVPRTSLSSFLCHYTEVARTDRIIASNFSSLTNMDPFDLTDYAGDFANDFDIDAASYDYYKACCEALETVRPEWCLLRNGEAYGARLIPTT